MSADSPPPGDPLSPLPSLTRLDAPLLLLLDLNETLIRTGQLSQEEGLIQTRELSEFVALCRSLTAAMGGLTLAFTTGNSFEYSRRIEEPLGVKNVPGLELIIISENGLICRSFRRGDLWREKPTEKYHREVSSFVAMLSNIHDLDGAYYSQGNELRTTLKPTANTFSSGELRLLERLHQDLLDPQEVRVYAHPFYLDLDPVRVMQESHSRAFGGKYEATKRLASETGHGLVLAIGDSASDLPMFEATHEAGGVNFLVANHNIDPPPENCQILSNSYTNGVNEVLATVLKGVEVEAPG